MKKVIKNNYKLIIGIIIGLVISVSGVYAATAIIQSKEVNYDNSSSHGSYTNVQDSIDELYERSGLTKSKWVDSTLNGNDPVLGEGMIPVTIDGNGKVYYASEYTEWYNYSEKRWANAVILTSSASKYSAGQEIPDKDIKGYFVWIPRYSYKIWNDGNYTKTMTLTDLKNTKETATDEGALWKITGNNTRIIDIKFVGKDTTDTGDSVGQYLTHPAFKLGSKVLTGIWVGKFETGGSSTDTMVVKPGVVSWRNKTVKEFFDAGKSFAQKLDSHMMKNTEWGAAAYLSHSQYGIGNEVNINNASDYYTGYSAAPGTNQSTIPAESAAHTEGTKTQPWNTPVGYLASTTGNISGIYDMSGGAWEYMAACVEGKPGSSGFEEGALSTEMTSGYIDKYPSDSGITTYNKRILGDATGEMGPFYSYFEGNGTSYNHSSWYGDYAYFVGSAWPWFSRGGGFSDGVVAGQFDFNRYSGEANGGRGFRVVLAPTK